MNVEQATEELFVRSKWATEKRVGVEHYRTGQVRVLEIERDEEEQRNFMLAYTPSDGHGINAFICRRAPAWEIIDNVRIRVDGLGFSVREIEGYRLSSAMVDALNQAFSEGE